jgi:hypothetical protein
MVAAIPAEPPNRNFTEIIPYIALTVKNGLLKLI